MTNHTSKERVRGEPWLLFNLCFLITHCGHTHLQRSCRKGIKNVNIRLEICFIVFVRCAYYRMTLSTCSIYIYLYIPSFFSGYNLYDHEGSGFIPEGVCVEGEGDNHRDLKCSQFRAIPSSGPRKHSSSPTFSRGVQGPSAPLSAT